MNRKGSLQNSVLINVALRMFEEDWEVMVGVYGILKLHSLCGPDWAISKTSIVILPVLSLHGHIKCKLIGMED